VRNLLCHAGILDGAPETAPTQWLDMPTADCFRFAEEDGMIEPCRSLGDPVTPGDVLARIHPVERTGLRPSEYRAAIGGILVARHFPGLVKAGDCLAVVGTLVGPVCGETTEAGAWRHRPHESAEESTAP
jgi:N-alpha-acetyl-L-2,4-diaminobutyrate deacetylase